MSFLSRFFGKQKSNNTIARVPATQPKLPPEKDPNMIRVLDGYGREFFITKQAWRDSVLLDNLEKLRGSPDELYSMLVSALNDGFGAEVVSYAEHLHRTDPTPGRGTAILAIVYLQLNRLDEAQQILEGCMAKHGEEGYLLTNLAKVHAARGNHEKAESILWHGLEVDPNQENGLGWYVAIQNERGGETAVLDAYRRVSALPNSWRSQLFLARDALQKKDLQEADRLYQDALSHAGKPAPHDALMQMSGDLGNAGYIQEIIRLVEPFFDVQLHGLQVGNNLIKAHVELGQLIWAREILNGLYAQKRPDWQPTLSFWDTEIAKAETALRAGQATEPPKISLFTIEGPLWARDDSSFAQLVPKKESGAKRAAVFGSTVQWVDDPAPHGGLQQADGPGRLSRVIPLFFAERIHLITPAIGEALIPWAEGQGFAVFGAPYSAQDLIAIAAKCSNPVDYIIGVHVVAAPDKYTIGAQLICSENGQCLQQESVDTLLNDPGPAVNQLLNNLVRSLTSQEKIKLPPMPSSWSLPALSNISDYLLRMEQQLAISRAAMDGGERGSLSGEREILNGAIQLCVREPKNLLVRMLFANTLRQMKKVRPEIVMEFVEKVNLLDQQHPIHSNQYPMIKTMLDEALA